MIAPHRGVAIPLLTNVRLWHWPCAPELRASHIATCLLLIGSTGLPLARAQLTSHSALRLWSLSRSQTLDMVTPLHIT